MQEEAKIKRNLSRKRIYLAIAICLFATAALFYYETRKIEFSWNELKFNSSSILYLFLALLMMVFRDLGYMVRIRTLTDQLLSWKQSFRVIMLWEFASALSPGVVGGSAVAMFILRKEKIPLGKASALVLVTAIMDNLFYILFLPLTLFLLPKSLLFTPDMDWFDGNLMMLIWTGYGIILGITLLLSLSLFAFPGLLKSLIQLIFKIPFLKKHQARGEKVGNDILLSSREIKGKSVGFWVKIFLATIWSWTSRYLVINFILLAFIEVGLWDQIIIFGRQLLMWVILLVTPTPGGSGMAEFLFTDFLSDFVTNGGLIVGLAFIWRLISYYPYLIIGSILLPKWFKRSAG